MDPFVGEIRIFAGNFAPLGWALCIGQLLPIQQNTALFSLLGTNYGGNGTTTFGLPNLQGRVPLHPGQGPGLSIRNIGESDGAVTVALDASSVPLHTHDVLAAHTTENVNPIGTKGSPANAAWGNTAGRRSGQAYNNDSSQLHAMSNSAINPVGGNQPHNNMQPYLVLNYIIALQGIFPPRW